MLERLECAASINRNETHNVKDKRERHLRLQQVEEDIIGVV